MKINKNNLYLLATLYFTVWGSCAFAQTNLLKNERNTLISPEIKCSNPALLQNYKDTIMLNAKLFGNFNKGDFVNYYEPNQSFKAGINSNSFIRVNDKAVVYGLASYYYSKGKNSGGTSFFYPYRIPFNFTPTADSTKGDIRIEQYRLSGGISYKLSDNLSLGAKIDYQTISYAKLKDMRNINDILELNLYSGLKYDFGENGSVGISYNYNRYIENMRIDKYGKKENNFYALLNKGAFMGLLYIYGDDGILDTDTRKRPWVEIVHKLGLQYTGKFNESTKLFAEFNYGIGKGHFGNDNDNSVVYTRHNTDMYSANLQFSTQRSRKTHIISIISNYNTVINNEQLYREVTTKQGNTITEYYGESQSQSRQKLCTKFSYDLFWGEKYITAPWHFNLTYNYKLLRRKVSYFPYYRKQNIEWHKYAASIAKTLKHNTINYSIKYSAGFIIGNGGFPVDGTYISSSGNSTKPDYLNDLLHKEREYLTAKRLQSCISLMTSKELKNNIIYLQLDIDYTKAFDTKFIKGDFFACELTFGFEF